MDAVRADPKHHRIEFENARVRVLRVVFAAGETSPEHEHPARVTVFLHDYQTTNRLPDGSVDIRRRHAGDTEWRPPVRHVPYADVAYENIQVEIKPHIPHPLSLDLPLDAARVDPQHHTIEFENEHVRVVRLIFGPHESSVMHEHAAGVLVFLTDFRGRFTKDDGTTVDEHHAAGEVSWRPAARYRFENLSERPLKAVLVEVK